MILKKTMAVAVMMLSGAGAATASDIIIDNAPGTANGTPGGFSYIGKGNWRDHAGGSMFDIYNMAVDRDGAGIMTVRINTKFVDINGTLQNGDYYYFGDLLMSTSGWNPTGNAGDGYSADNAYNTGTQWEYVYDLNGARYQSGSFTDTTSARLRELDSGYSTGDFEMGTYRPGHLYMAKNSAFDSTIGGGSVQSNKTGNYLEFIFDVSGTELATAEQIAFHWTMSCANDIIQGEASFQASVPAPAGLGLLFVGLGGMTVAHRRKYRDADRVA